mmetsp:Transcript_47903/g.113839  ORF Transcript_47903/g.113839 Transcript_47903/m.113839 type:complete len:316 (-) Transcript_47903:105-1052(-)
MRLGICCCQPSQDIHNTVVTKQEVERQQKLIAFNEDEFAVDDAPGDKVYGSLQPASGSYMSDMPMSPERREATDWQPVSAGGDAARFSGSLVSRDGSASSTTSSNRLIQPKALAEVFSGRPDIPARGCASSPEERLAAKEKLKGLLTDFLKAVFSGIWVTVLNPETALPAQFVMTMDRHLYVTLRPKASVKDGLLGFELKDGFTLSKGAHVGALAPKLAHLTANITCIEQTTLGVLLFFYFEDSWEAELFFSCLKVLQMSADISKKNRQVKQPTDEDGLPVPAVESSKGEGKQPEDPSRETRPQGVMEHPVRTIV